MTEKVDISSALEFDPFEGDFGSPSDRTLKDKIVKFRKSHRCHICDAITQVGEVGRSRVDVFDGDVYSLYFCNGCCVAMAEYDCSGDCELEGDGDKIGARYALGEARRARRAHEGRVDD